jgi:hypothetical protein
MDKELIERLSHEAGSDHWTDRSDAFLTRFAALVAEECAKLGEAEPMNWLTPRDVSDAIRVKFCEK